MKKGMNEVCQILENQPDYHPYKHIIVDEGQDFGMGAYRLLRALAGDDHENDLFIVGDAHQRIYKNKVILSKCKVYVQGRSSRLRINYRTTEEIRNWAMHVLKDIPFDDLDEGLDSSKGYRSLTHGEAPIVEAYNSINEEKEALVAHIKEMNSKYGYDYLPAPDRWYLSIWDHASGEMLVNQIPVICSYELVNDLLVPFRYLRDGAGLGSLFCLRNTDAPSTPDPAKGNLTEFQILWGDTFDDRQ